MYKERSLQCRDWSPAADEGSLCKGGIGGGSRGSLSDCLPFDAAVADICQSRMKQSTVIDMRKRQRKNVRFITEIECTVLCLNNLSDS